jgi:uncharacterized protein (TIGR03000 family)
MMAPAGKPADTMQKVPAGKTEAPVDRAATVVVKAPMDVQIRVNGQLAQRTKAEQAFSTPVLQAGYMYSYDFSAEAVRDGKSVKLARRVSVQAGQTTQVDFSEMTTEAAQDAARVTLVMPADARLFIDDMAFPLNPGQRAFDTPRLDAGQTYSYTLRAEVVRDGEKQTETQRINVEAGKNLTVEFKELKPVLAARR